MTPFESKKFLKVLASLGMAWLGLGVALLHSDPSQVSAFLQIFLYASLDLVFIVLLFWTVFFTDPERRSRKIQIVIFLTFKLVCLGFLAITLKRLRNASLTAILFGIGFVFIGPLLAGVIQVNRKGYERDTRI